MALMALWFRQMRESEAFSTHLDHEVSYEGGCGVCAMHTTQDDNRLVPCHFIYRYYTMWHVIRLGGKRTPSLSRTVVIAGAYDGQNEAVGRLATPPDQLWYGNGGEAQVSQDC